MTETSAVIVRIVTIVIGVVGAAGGVVLTLKGLGFGSESTGPQTEESWKPETRHVIDNANTLMDLDANLKFEEEQVEKAQDALESAIKDEKDGAFIKAKEEELRERKKQLYIAKEAVIQLESKVLTQEQINARSSQYGGFHRRNRIHSQSKKHSRSNRNKHLRRKTK